MARNIFFTLIQISFFSLFLCACSLYESSGRQAIEKDDGGIVTSGLSLKPSGYYACSRTYTLPSFLKEPLEVLETPFEKKNYSVLFNTTSTPNWLVIYRHHPSVTSYVESYDSCKFFFLKSEPTETDILSVVELGVEQLMRFNKSE